MTERADLEQIAIDPDHFATWTAMIKSKELDDYGLTLDPGVTEPRADGQTIYVFPREHLDAVLRDYDKSSTKHWDSES